MSSEAAPRTDEAGGARLGARASSPRWVEGPPRSKMPALEEVHHLPPGSAGSSVKIAVRGGYWWLARAAMGQTLSTTPPRTPT